MPVARSSLARRPLQTASTGGEFSDSETEDLETSSGIDKLMKLRRPAIEPVKRPQSTQAVSKLLLRLFIIFLVTIVGLFFGIRYYHSMPGLPKPTLVNDIRQLLDEHLHQYYCHPDSSPTKEMEELSISRDQLWNRVRNGDRYKHAPTDKNVPYMAAFQSDYKIALSQIDQNPSWNLAVDPVYQSVHPTSAYSPSFPFLCNARLIFHRHLTLIVGSVTGLIVVFFSVFYHRHSKKCATEEQMEVERLIEESIELLQSPDEPQSIPVLHIRDTLIPLSDRASAKYKKIWAKVNAHMEGGDSRVKIEHCIVDGDTFKAWKWIGHDALSGDNTKNFDDEFDTSNSEERIGGLRWQGTAFAKQTKSSSNSTKSSSSSPTSSEKPPKPISPAATRFLKIRNCYEKSRRFSTPDYPQMVRNSIIEKVINERGQHDITHIGIDEDEKECLIYVKCRTREGATGVYYALHGWWCENRLISVRNLKEERYYLHFPDARELEKPLEISTLD